MKMQYALRSVLQPLVIFLLISGEPSTAQNNAPSQGNAPSLKETLDWLKEKLTAYASFTETIANRDTIQKVDLVNFDGCTLTYRYARKSASIGLELLQTYTFSLGDIDSSKVKVEGKEGHYFLMFYALDNKPKIKMAMKAALMGPIKEESKWTDSARFPFDSTEMADRVSKAFIHAIGLCKSEKELFPSTITNPDTPARSEEKQNPTAKSEAIKIPATVLSVSLHDTAHPKFQSTDSGWCFMKVQNDDPARTISRVEAYIIIRDTMRDVIADRLHLNLEGKVKPHNAGEVSVSLGTYFLPNKWAASYRIERISFEDGSEWRRF